MKSSTHLKYNNNNKLLNQKNEHISFVFLERLKYSNYKCHRFVGTFIKF